VDAIALKMTSDQVTTTTTTSVDFDSKTPLALVLEFGGNVCVITWVFDKK
jgi:hypothetical protein